MVDEDATLAGIRRRGQRLSRWIERRPEQTLCLVSHAAIIGSTTNDTYMENCEVRTYYLHRGRWTRAAPTLPGPTLIETMGAAMQAVAKSAVSHGHDSHGGGET